jgi:hypothetical protein
MEPFIIPQNKKFPLFTEMQFPFEVEKVIIDRIESGLLKESSNDTKTAANFYLDALFSKIVCHFLWIYADKWNVDVVKLPSSRSGSGQEVRFRDLKEDSPTISCDELEAQAKGNEHLSLFLSELRNKCAGKMHVPQGTDVQLQIGSNQRKLILKNEFVRVCIHIQYAGGALGLGEHGLLLGYSKDEDKNYWTHLYRVRLDANFKKSRSGNTMMPDIQEWVNTMFCEIEDKCDAQKRLEREKQIYLLYGKRS